MVKLWIKFAVTQLMNVPLFLAGLFIVPVLMLLPTWPRWGWIWYNDDDGFGPVQGFWHQYVWFALRNPVDNLKHAQWPFEVATPGGPLLYKTWFWGKRQFYYKIGYMPHQGFPALSAGGGRGW